MSASNAVIKAKAFTIHWADGTSTTLDATTRQLEIKDTYMAVTSSVGRLTIVPYTNIKRIDIS